jgi:TatD DNase family protein
MSQPDAALFDVHAHLTSPRLRDDEAVVVARARAAGVGTIVSNGLNPADNLATLAVAARHPDLVRPALGLYPVDAVLPEMLAMGVEYHRDESEPPPDGDAAIDWLESHVDQAFAVGEVGLDHYWVPEALWALQEQRFRRIVRLAMAADKPLIIHTRKAERRAFEVLQEEGATRVVWHCYSSKVKLGLQIGRHGHWLSIPANVRKAQNFTKLLTELPRDKVLLETDCPYLSPVSGTRNEPANVAGTAAFAGERWGEPAAAVQRQLADNFAAVFGVAP